MVIAWIVYRIVRSKFTKNGMVLIQDLEIEPMFHDQRQILIPNGESKLCLSESDEREENEEF